MVCNTVDYKRCDNIELLIVNYTGNKVVNN